MKHAAFLCAALAASLLPACKSGEGFKIQDAMDGVLGDIDSLFGKSSVPGKHLAVIRDIHERKSWTFREGAEEPLQRTCAAVRALKTCDYVSWSEAALVTEILSSMADEHTSSLVRAEALDAITQIAAWTLPAASPPSQPSTNAEMIDAVKTLKAAIDQSDSDPAFTQAVAVAVHALANYPFDRVELGPAAAEGSRSAAKAYGTQLRTARGALRSINGRTLEGFQADATVRDHLDRAYVSLSAAVIRLTLAKSALGDSAATTRATALRDIGIVVPEGGETVIRTVLRFDDQAAVRREAAKALASYPAALAVPILLDGLTDEMTDVRDASARSLASLTGQTFGDDRAAWVRWWQAQPAVGSR